MIQAKHFGDLGKSIWEIGKIFAVTRNFFGFMNRGSGCVIGPFFGGIPKVQGLPWELHQTTSP